jgi:hypothetical protein
MSVLCGDRPYRYTGPRERYPGPLPLSATLTCGDANRITIIPTEAARDLLTTTLSLLAIE